MPSAALLCTSTSQCPSGYSCIGGVCKKNPSYSSGECVPSSRPDLSGGSGGSCGGSGSTDCSAPGCSGGNGEANSPSTCSSPVEQEDGVCNPSCLAYQQNFGEAAPGCSSAQDPLCYECINGYYQLRPLEERGCNCPGNSLSAPPCNSEECEKCNQATGICEVSCDECLEKCTVTVQCSCRGAVSVDYEHKKCENGSIVEKTCLEAATESINPQEVCGCPCDPDVTTFQDILVGKTPSECEELPIGPVDDACRYCEVARTYEIIDPSYVPPVDVPEEELPAPPTIRVEEWKKYDVTTIEDECCGECSCHADCFGRVEIATGLPANTCSGELTCIHVAKDSPEADQICTKKTYCTDNGTYTDGCPAGTREAGRISSGGQDCIICERCGPPNEEPDKPVCEPPRFVNGGNECTCPTVNGPNWPDDPLDRTVYAWDGTSCVPSCPTCSPIYPL